MTFYSYDHGSDVSPLMQGLRELGVVPLYLLAGGVAAGAALTRFLESDEWSAGEYNFWMDKMDATFHEWDALGWSHGCWNNAELRRQWLSFWQRFSKHYAAHGKVSSGWVSDSEEKPARLLLQELVSWGEKLNAQCSADIDNPSPTPPPPLPPPEAPWLSYVKWGAIGLSALVALNVISSVRNVLPRR